MFQPGEWIVYGTTGVCQIAEIKKLANTRKDYYVLKPCYQKGTIYTPIDQTSTRMRAVISKEEANALIDQIPEISAAHVASASQAELAREYIQKLKSPDKKELIGLILWFYAKQQEAKEKKRSLNSSDEKYMKQAKQLFHGELAVALDIPYDEVEPYIASRIETISKA